MDINNSAKTVSLGGILTAFAVLFQAAPVFLPGMGLILSPLATLPIALATIRSSHLGIIAFLSSAFILLLINPQEAIIFIMTTGLLGLSLGINHNKKIISSILVSATILLVGIILLKYIAGLAVFGGLTPNAPYIIEVSIFGLFTLFYSGIWVFIIKFITRFMKKVN